MYDWRFFSARNSYIFKMFYVISMVDPKTISIDDTQKEMINQNMTTQKINIAQRKAAGEPNKSKRKKSQKNAVVSYFLKLVITWNVYQLNSSIKRNRVAEWILKEDAFFL